jgi:hypothetical protein
MMRASVEIFARVPRDGRRQAPALQKEKGPVEDRPLI